MTANFQDRLAQAARLEKPFIAAFNDKCRTHRIFKFGIESTELRHLHEYIRSADDDTSSFIRYLPDSALVRIDGETSHISLLEFKVQDALVERDSFFGRIQRDHRSANQNEPPLQDKQDIFSLEKASLDLYQRLAEIGVMVVVVGWQTKRTNDADDIRVQYATRVVTCQVQNPSPELRMRGSGTVIANVHFGAFVPIRDFYRDEFEISSELIDAVVRVVRGARPTL